MLTLLSVVSNDNYLGKSVLITDSYVINVYLTLEYVSSNVSKSNKMG